MRLLQALNSLLEGFLSDRFRSAKLLILAGLYLGLAFYFREANPEQGAQWQRVVFRAAAGESFRGREVSLTHVHVSRLLPQGKGAVLAVGWPGLEVRALGLKGVEPGDRLDLNGALVGPTAMEVSEVRVHRGSHAVKVWISLIAACAALVLFFRAFRPVLRQGLLLLPRD